METQVDYEGEVLLAVFPSATAAVEARRALHAAGIESSHSLLEPGRYQFADVRLGRRFRAGIGAAIVGAIIGAALGAGLALWFFGAGVMVIVWLAVASALGGAIVGPLFGIERVSRYDDDVAKTTDIGPGSSAVVVRAQMPTSGARGSARAILERAGAIAFLDIAAYEARVRGRAEPTAVESTSAGDSAAPPPVPRFGQTQVRGAREGESEPHRPAA